MYYFDEFDGLVLTCLEADIGGQAAGDYMAMSAGQFDANGNEPTYHRGVTATAKLIALSSYSSGLPGQGRMIQGKIGRRGKLWRRWLDGQREWVYARLIKCAGKSTRGNQLYQEMQAEWQVESPVWFAETQTSVVATIGATPQQVTLLNSGNADARGVAITISGTTTPITGVKIGVSGVSEIQWAGSLGSGHSLVINGAARSVLKDATDDYDAFSLTANHKISDWLKLPPGSTPVAVTISPAGALPAAVKFEYYDTWK